MKKYISILAVLLMLSLTACSNLGTTPTGTGNTSNTQSESITMLDEGVWPVNEYTEGLPVPSGTVAWAMLDTEHENCSISIVNISETEYNDYFELLKQEGIDNEEIKKACLHAYRYQEPDIHLYPGVKELLEELRKEGYLLGVITDGRPEGQRAKIDALGLENLVDHIVVTDEFGGAEFRKPNPIAFQTMKEKLNTAYSEMCYIGDNIKKDFIAPQQLGMRSIWFKNVDGLYVK